jgi:glyceraldehyde 3-phosphate dehydrogenase
VTRVALNGFGRIGRLVFRHLMEVDDLELVAINDIVPLDNLAYLLRHDSVHADPKVPVEADGDLLRWGDRTVRYTSVKSPADLPWKDLGVEIVIEGTGIFTAREKAARHLEAGAGRVIITANGNNPDVTIVMGVNEDTFDPSRHLVIANGSCTTNCVAPVAKVIGQEFGIVTGFLTTTHSYTASQGLVDAPNKKWRRGRAAALSIVPTTTGAAVAVTVVLPHLKGKMDGLALRVPTPAGSISDLVFQTERPVTVESVNEALRRASQSDRLKGILGVSDEELVSMDIVGTEYSSLVDAESTMVLGEHTAKVLAWYDNEWAYARRVVDLTQYVAQNS